MRCIYLDHNATTPVDPRVLDALLPYLQEKFGNAASKSHPYGWAAAEGVEKARQEVAALLGASAREIVFTSGATEANNIAILGLFPLVPAGSRRHVVTQATEHHAVLDTVHELERRGFGATVLGTDRCGRVSAAQVREAITERTALVSIMAANNEIGTLQPLAEIGAVCKQAGVVFHTDAAQAVGKIPIDVNALGVDLLSLSGHKLYAPKGVGALYVRSRTPPLQLAPLSFGGGQERGLRSGTLNVPGIVGLGEACRIARQELPLETVRLAGLRDRLEAGLRASLDGLVRNGSQEHCLPGTLSLGFEAVDGAALLVSMPDLAVSSGSACTTGSTEPSYVLKALGVPDRLAYATARFSVGRFTTEAEVDAAIARVVTAVRALRGQMSRVAGAMG
jgi:cysteine desulfurase